MRILREIERLTPIVVLMEDIDSILEAYSESEVLNILDGIDEIERTVFLATTNYPELLGARILNRPSRFDKRFKIDYPNTESRMMYLKHLVGKRKPEDLGINLNKWVKDTERFTIAHLKELFIAVVILGDDYHDAVETLRSMKEFISSEHDNDKLMGFGGGPSSRD
jgi:SpoVK/Ycf46/Vps4 family AAA+-type ATPase